MKKTGVFILMALVVGLVAGCKTAKPDFSAFAEADTTSTVVVTNKLNPELLRPPTDLFVLGPGDELDIETQGNTNSRAPAVVGLDGKIYYSLLPGIDVWGLTLAQSRARLEEEMSKYINQPQITLSLTGIGSKRVWMTGRVNKPGVYPLAGSTTLLEALSMAGGTAKSSSSITTMELADLRHSFVMRDGKLLPVNFVRLLQEGDMSQNIYLKADDFVFLPSSLARQVYVLGAVSFPRAVPFSEQMTVLGAIANANGPIKDAYLSHVAILRGSLSEPHILEVNYKAIATGKAMDVPLEPGDIVFVPLSPYRFISEYADLIVTTFVRTWTANEGIRAVVGSSGSIGVSVPVGVR